MTDAGVMIDAEAEATAPADGYNLFFSVKVVMAIAPNVYPNVKYNPMNNFKGVAHVALEAWAARFADVTTDNPYCGNLVKELKVKVE